jgi:hypothetical protein
MAPANALQVRTEGALSSERFYGESKDFSGAKGR